MMRNMCKYFCIQITEVILRYCVQEVAAQASLSASCEVLLLNLDAAVT